MGPLVVSSLMVAAAGRLMWWACKSTKEVSHLPLLLIYTAQGMIQQADL